MQKMGGRWQGNVWVQHARITQVQASSETFTRVL